MKTRSLFMTAVGLVIVFAVLFVSGISSEAAVIKEKNYTGAHKDQNEIFDLGSVPDLAYTVDFEYSDPDIQEKRTPTVLQVRERSRSGNLRSISGSRTEAIQTDSSKM